MKEIHDNLALDLNYRYYSQEEMELVLANKKNLSVALKNFCRLNQIDLNCNK